MYREKRQEAIENTIAPDVLSVSDEYDYVHDLQGTSN